MPTYVYRRPDGTTFEVFQKISDAPLTEDPDSGAPVQRVISGGAGLQFKGDGFYLTDYARKGSGSSESKAESSGTGESKKADAKKSESKPTATAASSDD
jgi:putative FmdB family regulatory protein